MGATIKQTHFEPLPVGEYQATIGAAAMEDGQFGTQVKFRFDVTTPGFEARSVTGWASATFSPKSKLYQWTRAAFGRDIPPEYDLNLDHLLDRPVVLVLVTKTGDDGAEYNKIHDVRPVRRNGSAPAPAPTVPTDDRAILKPRPPLTAATAAGVPAGPVAVNTWTPPLPDDVPDWLNDDGDGVDDLPA